MTWYVVYKIWKILKIKSAYMHVSNRLHLLLIWVQNSISLRRSMIATAERQGEGDPYWLLAAAHASGLYEKFIRSLNLIDLLKSASSREDFLLDWFEFFFFPNLWHLFRDWRWTFGGYEHVEEERRRNNFFSYFSLFPNLEDQNLKFIFALTQRERTLCWVSIA